MRKKDLDFVKNLLDNDIVLNDYYHVCISRSKSCILIFYANAVVTICEFGFAYLVSWYSDGSMTSNKANKLDKLCRTYNGRF